MDQDTQFAELKNEIKRQKELIADLLIHNDYLEQYYAAMVYGSQIVYEVDATADTISNLPAFLYEFFHIDKAASYTELMHAICKSRICEADAETVETKTSCKAIINAFEKGARQISVEYLSKDNTERMSWYRDRIYLIQHPVSGHICGVVTIKGINTQKQDELKLIDRAQHDPLTHLCNRSSMEERVGKELNDSSLSHGVMIIDVDDFKSVNDTFGHQTGDAVLSRFGAMLAKKFRQYDVVSRIGGDEFMVFMKTANPDIVLRRAEEIRLGCADLFPDRPEIKVTISMGIAMYPQHGSSLEELYANADTALYTSKKAGKNQITVYRTGLAKSATASEK